MGSLSSSASSLHHSTATMNKIIFFTLLAVAAARPDGSPEVAIVRSDVISLSADGAYSFDVETSDGMVRAESGAGTGEDGAVESQGSVRFAHPNGYQPESSALPVAPAFPHPIPQFVLDQIAF